MTRILMTAILATFAIALSACEPGACEGPECDSGTTTDPTTSDFGYIAGQVKIEGTDAVCQIAAFDGTKLLDEHFTDDGSTLEVKAGKSVTVCAGNPNIKDTNEEPIHTEPDDSTWVAPCTTEAPAKDATVDPVFNMNRYFKLEGVTCSIVDWYWQDGDWVDDDDYVVGTRTIEVLNGGDVVFNESIGSSVLEDHLITMGSGFALSEDRPNGYSIDETDTVITNDRFVVTRINDEWDKVRLTCE